MPLAGRTELPGLLLCGGMSPGPHDPSGETWPLCPGPCTLHQGPGPSSPPRNHLEGSGGGGGGGAVCVWFPGAKAGPGTWSRGQLRDCSAHASCSGSGHWGLWGLHATLSMAPEAAVQAADSSEGSAETPASDHSPARAPAMPGDNSREPGGWREVAAVGEQGSITSGSLRAWSSPKAPVPGPKLS